MIINGPVSTLSILGTVPKTSELALSFAIVSDQLDMLGLEIDLLNEVALEIELTYLSSTTYLTPSLMDPDQVKDVFEETNDALKNVGKKIAVSIAQKYTAG